MKNTYRFFVAPECIAGGMVRISDRDLVRLSSPWGEVETPIVISDEVMPGSLGFTQGWGHEGTWRRAVAAS